MIKIGDAMPADTLVTATADGPAPISSSDLFDGKTVVLFAVPGAFTPTCHLNHMPGFVEKADALKAKGVDTIACLSVNDPFVMKAWGEATGSLGKITLIADGSAKYVTSLGLELDMMARGLGMRAKRFAMIVKDGKLANLMIEETPGTAEASGADAVLAAL